MQGSLKLVLMATRNVVASYHRFRYRVACGQEVAFSG
jgi:hypothetical protein